jgi:hypothetical protein
VCCLPVQAARLCAGPLLALISVALIAGRMPSHPLLYAHLLQLAQCCLTCDSLRLLARLMSVCMHACKTCLPLLGQEQVYTAQAQEFAGVSFGVNQSSAVCCAAHAAAQAALVLLRSVLVGSDACSKFFTRGLLSLSNSIVVGGHQW